MKLLLLPETPFYALKKDQRSEDIFGGESGFQDAEEGDLDDRWFVQARKARKKWEEAKAKRGNNQCFFFQFGKYVYSF